MFDIGFVEVLIVGIVTLLVVGPDRLPHAARTAGLWLGRIKRQIRHLKSNLEQEIGADDIRLQLHNEDILAKLAAQEEQAAEQKAQNASQQNQQHND